MSLEMEVKKDKKDNKDKKDKKDQEDKLQPQVYPDWATPTAGLPDWKTHQSSSHRSTQTGPPSLQSASSQLPTIASSLQFFAFLQISSDFFDFQRFAEIS